jgi:hypothetical protein
MMCGCVRRNERERVITYNPKKLIERVIVTQIEGGLGVVLDPSYETQLSKMSCLHSNTLLSQIQPKTQQNINRVKNKLTWSTMPTIMHLMHLLHSALKLTMMRLNEQYLQHFHHPQ